MKNLKIKAANFDLGNCFSPFFYRMVYIFFTFIIRLIVCYWEVRIFTFLYRLILRFCLIRINFNLSEVHQYFILRRLGSLLVFLSILLGALSLLSTSFEKRTSYILTILLLVGVLWCTFSTRNIMFFYIFFEISLIPTLYLIIRWGNQPERLQAGSYILLYTVRASLPLLLLILYLRFTCARFRLFILRLRNINLSNELVIILYCAFLVKLPIYRFHLWLPKAHVEAPLAGSIILAGILLKLGGYGLFLLNKSFNIEYFSLIISGILRISLWGGVLASFICLRQNDLKAIVAYSSVVHISLIISGILINSVWGVLRIKIILFAHGFTSSRLFLLAYINYSKVRRRRFSIIGGILRLYPILRLFWFVLCSVNIGVPPTLNLLGEIFAFPVLWIIRWLFIIFLICIIFLSVIYNIYIYSLVNHGKVNEIAECNTQVRRSVLLRLLIHLIPLLILFKINYFF